MRSVGVRWQEGVCRARQHQLAGCRVRPSNFQIQVYTHHGT